MAAICYDTETFYDVILIDGQDCMSYIGYAIKRISEGGMIIVDNSDYSRYRQKLLSVERELSTKFKRLDFLLPGPCSRVIGWKNSIYQKVVS